MDNQSSNLSLKDILNDWGGESTFQDLNWTGTFDDYLKLVKENPRVTRNAFQRMYDMVLQEGTEEYIDCKKKIIRYKFFDDAENNNQDAVFGLDISLMKLVNVLRSAALGYGTEKRVILLHGPVGSAKSTICRRLKKGIEAYSRTPQGALYTFEWVDSDGVLDGLLGKDTKVYTSPMHEEPLLLFPTELRSQVEDSINKGLKDELKFKESFLRQVVLSSKLLWRSIMVTSVKSSLMFV